jgi:hypothetical protein
LPLNFTLISCLAHSSTLKMAATCSSETSVDFKRTTRRYAPEDRALYNHCWENLKSYTSQMRSRCPNRQDFATTNERTVWFGAYEDDLCSHCRSPWLRNRGNTGGDNHVTPTKKLTVCGLRTTAETVLRVTNYNTNGSELTT